MAKVDVSRGWPADGRVGRVTAGEYSGAWAPVTRESDDLWFIYLAWEGPPPR